MLYEMLTGRLPLYAKSMETYMQKHLTEELNSIVMQCLQKNPKDRYHNFTELKEELMEIYKNITGQSYKLSEIIEQELSAEAWNNKGKSLYNLGRIEDAINCFDKALSRNPRHANAIV